MLMPKDPLLDAPAFRLKPFDLFDDETAILHIGKIRHKGESVWGGAEFKSRLTDELGNFFFPRHLFQRQVSRGFAF